VTFGSCRYPRRLVGLLWWCFPGPRLIPRPRVESVVTVFVLIVGGLIDQDGTDDLADDKDNLHGRHNCGGTEELQKFAQCFTSLPVRECLETTTAKALIAALEC
jgi:hypothetical protein